jgi:hypothetical protein
MPNTFELIASSTLGSSASTIDFTSIPSTYTDLCLKLSLRTDYAGLYDEAIFRYNNDSTSPRYSYRTLLGSGSGVTSGNNTGTSFGYLGRPNGTTSTASTFASFDLYIPNYSGTTWNKSSSLDYGMENNATAAELGLFANLYAQTTAINRITISSFYSANFVQYSTAYLYGVKNA